MRENVKWIEVRTHYGWEKRVLLEVVECMAFTVHNLYEKNYLNFMRYEVLVWEEDFWREIQEPTFEPFPELTEEVKEKLRGKWVRNKETNSEYSIEAMCTGNDIYLLSYSYSLEELFLDFEFLDGSIIGQEVASR